MRGRHKPPKRHCRECGGDVYSWTEAPLCTACVRDVPAVSERDVRESLNDFRRRVIDPGRNA